MLKFKKAEVINVDVFGFLVPFMSPRIVFRLVSLEDVYATHNEPFPHKTYKDYFPLFGFLVVYVDRPAAGIY